MGGITRKQTTSERMAVNIMTPDNNTVVPPALPLPNQRRMPAFERFGGGQPFSHLTANPDNYFGNDVDDSTGNSNVYYVQRRNKSQYGGP